VESYRPEGGKCGFVGRNFVTSTPRGNAGDQQARDTGYFGMNCKARASTRHAISRLDVSHAFANSNGSTGAAVTRTLRLIKTATDGLNRGE
jgi:hypothetical protein